MKKLRTKSKQKPAELSTQADENFGLSQEQVQTQILAGQSNEQSSVRSKPYGQIIWDNTMTYFNLLNLVLGIIVIALGSYRNALFLLVVFCNIVIGIFQEIRAKKAVDKLSLISQPEITVLREGREQKIPVSNIVKGDIILLEQGSQICADCTVISGSCEVDESLLTGEADAIFKKGRDALLSGSFLISGKCKARVEKVGLESYANSIANEAKVISKSNSEIIKELNRLIKLVSWFILPFGAFLFCKQYFLLHSTLRYSAVSAIAAIIGMIPEGLILLTSMVLTVGVIRLAKKKTLVQDLYCIETLARVDTLCLDKTGTITTGEIRFREVLPLTDFPVSVDKIVGELIGALEDHNSTFLALEKHFCESTSWECCVKIPFSPIRKWSGACFAEQRGSYILGASEILCPHCTQTDFMQKVVELEEKGQRVLLLAHKEGRELSEILPDGMQPLALLILEDVIRPEAEEIFSFFQKEGVELVVISGDSAKTAYAIAKRAGVQNIKGHLDIADLSEEELEEAIPKTSVFGRVAPKQKKQIIASLKKQGHTVGMVGDGVNDVLALKEASCGMALASGSDAAITVSPIVLLDSNLHALYNVVMEGRRVINNLKRSASLFLVKTVLSFLLSVIFLIIPSNYPILPIQFSLIGALFIGTPSFILALQPNQERVTGSFLADVLVSALPGAFSASLLISLISILQPIFAITQAEVSTLSMLTLGFCFMFVLFQISLPLNWLRATLFTLMSSLFLLAVLFIPQVLYLTAITPKMLLIALGVALLIWPLNALFTYAINKVRQKWEKRAEQGKAM